LTFSLKQALQKGPVVLYFFPAAFSKGCTIEAHAFAEATDDFKNWARPSLA
jgi:peroxiredoxin